MSECPQRPASDSRVSASGARESHFLAILSRMKYIERWALMRSSRPENLSEHALDVALIAHALASLGNARHGRHLDADRAAVLGLFHDASEIITGDMPTPVKYHDAAINEAYKAVEAGAEARLLATLPEDLRGVYGTYFFAGDGHGGSGAAVDGDEAYLRRLVKAADKTLPSSSAWTRGAAETRSLPAPRTPAGRPWRPRWPSFPRWRTSWRSSCPPLAPPSTSFLDR